MSGRRGRSRFIAAALGLAFIALQAEVHAGTAAMAAPPDDVEAHGEAFEPGGEERAAEPPLPEKYTLDYPAAGRFCPPVRFAFAEANRTLSTVGRRTFRHPANGNFGYVQRVQGRTLVHVGADLALWRVGEPVFAVADGVVRVSTGPAPPTRAARSAAARAAEDAATAEPQKDRPAGAAPWGNLVAIEHRLPGGGFVTTIYGHLDTDRLVQAGDIVRAGQQIGEVGRRHPQINGGYEPHLHFGVKDGRLAEVGRGVLPLNLGGGRSIARIAALTEDELELDPGQPLPEGAGDFRMTVGGVRLTFRRRGERYVVPARILWLIPSTPEFPLVGHAPAAEGFVDPIAFLRRHQADTRPAPFLFARGNK